jgi:hypothetical protein
MKKEILNQVRDALVCVGRITMEQYQTDLLYDFAGCLESFRANKEFTIFVNKSCTHNKQSFLTKQELEEGENVGIITLIARAECTLGVDFVFGMRNATNGIEVEIINVNLSKDKLTYLVDSIRNHSISVRVL